jgi:hypothetical protein
MPQNLNECACSNEQDADETAMLAATLADEDDDLSVLATKVVMQLRAVITAEVSCLETGDGAIFTDDSFESD